MSWSDIFYPNNSKMKEKLGHLSGQLYALLENCFTAVNHLIDCIEKYLPGQKFEKIAMRTWLSLRDNINLIICRANEINAYLETSAQDVERRIGTELFNRLMSLDTTFQQKIVIAKNIAVVTCGLALEVAGLVLMAMIKSGKILTKVVAKLGLLCTNALATIGLAVFGLAVDMIISAILGAIEKNKLENALEEYTKAIEIFKPAAEDFYDNISIIRVMLTSTNRG